MCTIIYVLLPFEEVASHYPLVVEEETRAQRMYPKSHSGGQISLHFLDSTLLTDHLALSSSFNLWQTPGLFPWCSHYSYSPTNIAERV